MIKTKVLSYTSWRRRQAIKITLLTLLAYFGTLLVLGFSLSTDVSAVVLYFGFIVAMISTFIHIGQVASVAAYRKHYSSVIKAELSINKLLTQRPVNYVKVS